MDAVSSAHVWIGAVINSKVERLLSVYRYFSNCRGRVISLIIIAVGWSVSVVCDDGISWLYSINPEGTQP